MGLFISIYIHISCVTPLPDVIIRHQYQFAAKVVCQAPEKLRERANPYVALTAYHVLRERLAIKQV